MSRETSKFEPSTDQRDTLACIRQALDQARTGMGRSAEEVLDELEREPAKKKLRPHVR